MQYLINWYIKIKKFKNEVMNAMIMYINYDIFKFLQQEKAIDELTVN